MASRLFLLRLLALRQGMHGVWALRSVRKPDRHTYVWFAWHGMCTRAALAPHHHHPNPLRLPLYARAGAAPGVCGPLTGACRRGHGAYFAITPPVRA